MSDHSSYKWIPTISFSQVGSLLSINHESRTDDISLSIQNEDKDNNIHKDIKKESFEADLYFDDGRRRIDFVLVYRVDETSVGVGEAKKKGWREEFLKNLVKEGLQFETIAKQHAKAYFIKIHAPWDVLTRYAEIMNMKMPLAENDMQLSSSLLERCPTPFHYNAAVLPELKDHFTAAFTRIREAHGVFIVEEKETFFSPAQRSMITNTILSRAVFEDFGDPSKNRFGINKLLSLGAYTACYPLHEGNATTDGTNLEHKNLRHLLHETWAKPKVWYKFQPLDHIRLYFGEKIGIYFTWLGCYTVQLIPAGFVGLIVFLYGCFSLGSNKVSEEICDQSSKTSTGNIVMCPLCDGHCTYWRLHVACSDAKITYLFDNTATVFFAGFMALWATYFHEMWKRRRAEIQYDWDVADCEEEEILRPEFEAAVRWRRINPVTKIEEPFMKTHSRVCRLCSSVLVVIFMLCVVIIAVVGVIVYRVTVSAALYAVNDTTIKSKATLITSISAACLNLVAIITLGQVYKFIARFLTDFEIQRTQTEWENSLILKIFLFQFVNNNASLFYIGLIKGKLVGRPGAYNQYVNGQREEECGPAGCLIELSVQLAIIMLGKQALSNLSEILLPKVGNWFKARQIKEEKEKLARWEKDYIMLPLPPLGLFEEYLEMVLQFGFVTIFVAAFPLAPLFAFLNNIIELRVDAYKFVTQWRRPLAKKAQDIGIWFGILQGISHIAVISNAFIIAFTSEFIPRIVYSMGDKYGIERGDNYIQFTLSKFNTSDFNDKSRPDKLDQEIGSPTYCWFRGFYNGPNTDKPYELSILYWHILAARLAFVIVFIFAVHTLSWLISFLVPDVPRNVKLQILREKYLAKEAFIASEQLRV